MDLASRIGRARRAVRRLVAVICSPELYTGECCDAMRCSLPMRIVTWQYISARAQMSCAERVRVLRWC